METVNPYQPPTLQTPDEVPNSPLRFLSYLVPAALAVGLTLLLWVVLMSILQGVTGHRFSLLLWAFTLLLSASTSVVVLNHLWRKKIQPLAFCVAFAAFSIVFVFAEGDTSDGTDYWNMTIVYGTLLTLPINMCFLARHIVRDGRDTL